MGCNDSFVNDVYINLLQVKQLLFLIFMLDILGHTNEPDLMHHHIKYIFQAINSLVLDEKKTEIIAFESSYSERVLLKSVSMSLIVNFSLFW